MIKCSRIFKRCPNCKTCENLSTWWSAANHHNSWGKSHLNYKINCFQVSSSSFVRNTSFNSIVLYFKELLYFFSQIVGSIIRISQNDISGWWTDHNYLWHLRMCLWELQSSTLQQIKVLRWKYKEQHHNLSWSHLK